MNLWKTARPTFGLNLLDSLVREMMLNRIWPSINLSIKCRSRNTSSLMNSIKRKSKSATLDKEQAKNLRKLTKKYEMKSKNCRQSTNIWPRINSNNMKKSSEKETSRSNFSNNFWNQTKFNSDLEIRICIIWKRNSTGYPTMARILKKWKLLFINRAIWIWMGMLLPLVFHKISLNNTLSNQILTKERKW